MSGTEPKGTGWLSVTMNRREIWWPALPTQTAKIFPTLILSRMQARASTTLASEERKEKDSKRSKQSATMLKVVFSTVYPFF